MIDTEAYRSIERAQCEGTYPELLSRIASKVHGTVEGALVHELETIRHLKPEERTDAFDRILRYWSRAKADRIARKTIPDVSAFEETSLRLERAIKYTRTELQEGQFKPSVLGKRLMESCRQYDRRVTVPLTTQILDELKRDFLGDNILFLGRDFTSLYLYAHASRILPPEEIFLANVSRNVRDGCLSDPSDEKLRELRVVLARCGLTAERLKQGQLVIVDTSMKGKIPAIIFRALALDMGDKEAFEFLTHCHIRYVRSGRREGKPLHLQALDVGEAMNGLLSKEERSALLTSVGKIEEFKELRYPPQIASYIPRRHKIFEWRPKTLQVATGTQWGEPGESAQFTSDLPTTPSERVMCLLGLMLDVQTLEMGAEAYRLSPLLAVRTPSPIQLASSLDSVKDEIQSVFAQGHEAVRRWQRRAPVGLAPMTIVATKEDSSPYELYLGEKPVARLRQMAGEGNNVIAYVTENDTVLKIAKNPAHARKNLLLAWAENLVKEYGMDVAPVLNIGPEGLYVEQEHIPGENLETRFSEQFESDPQSVPEDIVKQILRVYLRAAKLRSKKGIYLDLKSANFQLRENGTIVNVDYTPRVNRTYYRYFNKDDGSPLKFREFLDMFFCHDRRKRCLRK